MADRGFLKHNLRYHRVLMVCIVFISIWLQYNYSTEKNNYSNGQPKIEGEKVNGKDEGVWVWYYPSGKKQMEGSFQEGKRIGTWYIWNENGVKVSESVYANDKLNGPFWQWNTSGKLIRKGKYQNDRVIQLDSISYH